MLGYLRNIIASRMLRGREPNVLSLCGELLGRKAVVEAACRQRPELAKDEEFRLWAERNAGEHGLSGRSAAAILRGDLLAQVELRLSGLERRLDHELGERLETLRQTFGLTEAEIEIVTFALLEKSTELIAARGVPGGFFLEEDLKALCRDFSVNAAGIVSAISGAAIDRRTSRDRALRRIRTILRNHEKASGGAGEVRPEKAFERCSLEGLNASADLGCIVGVVKCAFASGGETRSISLLLHGMPGTGKSEFAFFTWGMCWAVRCCSDGRATSSPCVSARRRRTSQRLSARPGNGGWSCSSMRRTRSSSHGQQPRTPGRRALPTRS